MTTASELAFSSRLEAYRAEFRKWDKKDWEVYNRTDMFDVWNKLKPADFLPFAISTGVLTDKELLLFAVFCARQVEYLLTDQRSRDAIDVAERLANDKATAAEQDAALDFAWDAAEAVAAPESESTYIRSATEKASFTVFCALLVSVAAQPSAFYVYQESASAAADAADTPDAEFGAARVARDAAYAAQAEWLRANTKPKFY